MLLLKFDLLWLRKRAHNQANSAFNFSYHNTDFVSLAWTAEGQRVQENVFPFGMIIVEVPGALHVSFHVLENA
jgi:hypothetical protein